jgi:predicted acetylornithine/succinylornithine family transaminase
MGARGDAEGGSTVSSLVNPSSQEVVDAEARYLVQTYKRPSPVFVRGDGVHLEDADGRRYLDFMSGIAVMALGHADPAWSEAVCEQARTLTHVSNLFHTVPHVELARRLVERSFADRVFLCNSGAEANEAALKFARKYARSRHGPEKHRVVAFTGGFHGRTVGALSCTANSGYRDPFTPLMGGVNFAPFNDAEAAATMVDDTTCAVIVEPLQGEGGVWPAAPGFLAALRETCRRHDALLIFDEVQCGLGRTGTLWAHETDGVTPDIMTLAKPLAGGLPIGATLVTDDVAEHLRPGDHGSTFAAGPLVCRAAQVVVDRVSDPAFLQAVRERGDRLREGLAALRHPAVREIRGRGLLLGLELAGPAAPVVQAAREQGVLIIGAGEKVVRLTPPLVVTPDQVDQAVRVLGESLAAATASADGQES